jgi:putative ABC transport system ATP-binding protein
MTVLHDLTTPVAAARGRALTKVYGDGDTRVVALDAVDVTFTRGRFTAIMGPVRVGQVDAHALHGRSRHAQQR